ncbi:hypothetical protein BCV70DRAFT_196957 [Testicularia cyperi]|uniref:Peroxisome assembly protein 12 n=1 Tax=Testicularia cyperi TaxID=1882483 RepID=A0A317XXT4_9BASI|nr:hypothetical protein BCV70DRAFT_196957 [Testicularia cyperi]
MDVLTSIDPTSSQASASDPFHPSFFELAAQSQLQDLIKPAFRYVLAVLAQRNPRYLLRLVNKFDEVYAVGMLGVESHYLRVWGSSFSENFYGLKRRKRPALHTSRAKASSEATSVSIASAERLTKREIRLSLLFLVGLPYLGAKLDDYWESIGGGVSSSANLFGDDPSNDRQFRDREEQLNRITRIRESVKNAFRQGYPYAKTLYQLWLLTYNVRYLFDKTPFWRPWLHLMRVDIRRIGPNDGSRVPLTPKKFPSLTRQPLAFFSKLLQLAPGLFFESLKYGLPASIFFFKFLEWWYGADNPRRRSNRAAAGSGASGGGAGQSGPSELQLDPPAPLPPHPRGILSSNPDKKLLPNLPEYKPPHIFVSTSLDDDDASAPPPAYTEKDHASISTATTTKPTLLSPSPSPASKSNQRSLIHNSCPLCGAMPINNPAVLPSGYVYCYTCAFNFLSAHKVCPVTLIAVPDGTNSLRKVLG